MKNLILIIAILFTGTINAQSFKDHKDLLSSVGVDSSLSSKGFINSGTSEAISMSYLDINEKATTYVNDSTGEIVKISKNNVEYLYDGDKLVKVDSRRFELTQNLLYVMTKKIEGGWTDIDVIITMPPVMAKVGKLGRILGPRGLMPNPKSGTVTMDIGKAVTEVKMGKIDFKVDKFGIIHTSIGKASFSKEKIIDNATEMLNTVSKLKPASAKGTYIKSIYLSSTMSPGVAIDQNSVSDL